LDKCKVFCAPSTLAFNRKEKMGARVLLISHAATPAMRQGRFPADDSLDARGLAEATAWRQRMPATGDAVAFSSPAACACDTAQVLGLAARVAPELAETDYGQWRGRRLADVAQEAPHELATWSRDPHAAVRGGESFVQVLTRVGGWLDSLDETASVVAITHAPVIRAALIHALNAPATSFTRIEIAPLSVVELRRSARGWAWWPTQS
jgi:broad specificity phosphatase PhoE